MSKKQIYIEAPEVSAGCYALTKEQAESLFTPEQIASGEFRGEIKTQGPWGILSWYSSLATSQQWESGVPLKIYGRRALLKPRQLGYELEGIVSVQGKRYRGFTSSTLFELHDKRLLSCAIIHVCTDQPK